MKQGNTHGGGAKTNENGLGFERKAATRMVINKSNKYASNNIDTKWGGKNPERFSIVDTDTGQVVGQHYKTSNFNKEFLGNQLNINLESIVSKKLLPDSVVVGNTINIIEHKFQESEGSVDEKLQTCLYKKEYYERLVKDSKYDVNYIYVLNKNYFDKPKHRDLYNWIEEKNCKYFFDELPLSAVGL